MRKLLALTASLFALTLAAQATTLEDVKARGKLNCGVNAGLMGFAEKGADGAWAGLDVDYCKALAAAFQPGARWANLAARAILPRRISFGLCAALRRCCTVWAAGRASGCTEPVLDRGLKFLPPPHTEKQRQMPGFNCQSCGWV